ncbi:MAG: WG repeat-containing protein [Bacteroidia bacterium]
MDKYQQTRAAGFHKRGIVVLIFVGIWACAVAQEPVRRLFKEKGKWGYLDEGEQIVIPPSFQSATPFHLGRAVVQQKRKWGQIDTSGKVIIPIRYDRSYFIPGDGGLILVSRKGKKGIVDTTGRVVLPARYDQVYPFWMGISRVGRSGKMGFIDTTGKWVIPMKYDSLTHVFGSGQVFAIDHEKWGVLDLEGQIKVPLLYDSLSQTSVSGLFVGYTFGKPGYIDTLGNEIFTYREELLPDPQLYQKFDSLKNAVHQLENCSDRKKIEKQKAIDIAVSAGLASDKNTDIRPDVRNGTCTWKISSVIYTTTREGDCRFTNGCTVVVTNTYWIDSITGDLLHRETKRKLYPNYE